MDRVTSRRVGPVRLDALAGSYLTWSGRSGHAALGNRRETPVVGLGVPQTRASLFAANWCDVARITRV